jgi:hypothetical protein
MRHHIASNPLSVRLQFHSSTQRLINLQPQKSPPPEVWTVAEHHTLIVPSPSSSGEDSRPVVLENARQDSVAPVRSAIEAMGGWGEECERDPDLFLENADRADSSQLNYSLSSRININRPYDMS